MKKIISGSKMKLFFIKYSSFTVIGLLAISFIILSSEVKEAFHGQTESISIIDHFLTTYLIEHRSPILTEAAINITALGSKWVLTLITFFSVTYLICLKRYRESLAIFLTATGASILNSYLKNVFEIPRPDLQSRLVEAHGFSYPSGHSQASTAIYLSITFILVAHLKSDHEKNLMFLISSLFIGMIGLSRIYLGVHYFSDVTAGIIIGLLWATSVHLFTKSKSIPVK